MEPLSFLFSLHAAMPGLVDKGVEFFQSMSSDHGLTPGPGIEHYATVVDLLGRARHLQTVQDWLLAMPRQPDMAMSLCLLAACRNHGNVVLGKHAFDCAVSLQPKHAAPYVLMSNVYADGSLWDCAEEVNELRQKTEAWKVPGQGWIDHQQQVHTFQVGESELLEGEALYELLRKVFVHLKAEAGWFCSTQIEVW